jgi:hypothetical protein
MVILDNATRWNSTYNSLHRGLKLRRRLDLFSYQYIDDLGKDYLANND